MPTRDIIVLTVVFISLPVCFIRPFYGVLLWTVLAFLNPQSLSWGIARTVPMAMIVAIPTLGGALLFSKVLSGLKYREVFLLVVLWIWFTLTALNASRTPEFLHYQHDTWQRWTFVSKILLMVVVSIGVVDRWSRLRYFLLAIAGTFGLFILQAIPWAIYTAGRERLYGPEGSMLADNNDFGLALNMTSPIFFFLATTESKPWVRRLMAFLFLASIPAVFLTYSRGSLISLAVVVFLMLMRLPQRFALVPVLMIAALFALYFAPDRWVNRMDFRREGAVLDDSALSRINAWTYSWRLAVNYPLMGGGFEAFTPTLFYRYAPNPLDVHGPHSIYFGILAEHGFIGLFLYLALVASCLKTLQQVRKYGRQSQNDRAAAYALMLQFCLLAFLVAGAFLGRAYFDYYFTIVACTVMLKRICQAEAAELECAPVEPEAEEQMA